MQQSKDCASRRRSCSSAVEGRSTAKKLGRWLTDGRRLSERPRTPTLHGKNSGLLGMPLRSAFWGRTEVAVWDRQGSF
jgi:hypothetical protein